jgi:aldehyde dehydrogenase (NAD+)
MASVPQPQRKTNRYSGFERQPIAGEWRSGRGKGRLTDRNPWLRERIAEARASGARQTLGGEPQGLVLPPHVFADVRNEMHVAREELFGPVAPIVRAADDEEALRLANQTAFGLSSCVFGSLERATRFAQRLEAGMAHVNDQPVNDLPNNPFGGEKNSGIGRFGGDWAVEAFTSDKWLTVQHIPRRYPASAEVLKGPWAGG